MPVFKIAPPPAQPTFPGGSEMPPSPLKGGVTREAGLQQLKDLDATQSQEVLKGLRTNLLGADGTPKHGVLKLRNSSSTDKEMEFARMRGMDRWFSKRGTFANTGKALQILMERTGMKPETAEALIKQYSANDGSIKYKDAVTLINRVLPETSSGTTVEEALKQAKITGIPEKGMANEIAETEFDDHTTSGAQGVVYEGRDHGTPCMLKRNKEPLKIELTEAGGLVRGKKMDGNHLAAGKLPGVIAPNRYLLSKTDANGDKTYHVVTAGGPFKEFCKKEGTKGATLMMEGLIMDKAKGTRMLETRSSASNQKEIAKGFTAILMNASSRGFVLGDIKGLNAFVDGGKVTLIDTDGAFKQSKVEQKTQKDPILTGTYIHPTASSGQQQDLYSLGITLLVHSYRSQGPAGNDKVDDLLNAGKESPGDKFKYDDDTLLANRLESIRTVVGSPSKGSVEDFALECIETALKEGNKYETRFTGQVPHLLDPILDHPLIGGREAFIQKNLLPRNAGQVLAENQIPNSDPGLLVPPSNDEHRNSLEIEEEDEKRQAANIGSEDEKLQEQMDRFMKKIFGVKPRGNRRSSSSSDDE